MMATLISSKTEYQFSEEEIKSLIAKELGVGLGQFSIRFDREEKFIPGDHLDIGGSYIYTIRATIDHAKNKETTPGNPLYRNTNVHLGPTDDFR